MSIILGGLGIGFIALAAVVVVRALRFTPEAIEPANPDVIELDKEKIVADMVDMVRCKTLSYSED